MDVKFNIFPTMGHFGQTVGDPANTKDHGDINVIENEKMMILNGERYKFSNYHKKQPYCGPGMYVDKIFMGKNAWVPRHVPVGYKCLIRKGQTMFLYNSTVFINLQESKLRFYTSSSCTDWFNDVPYVAYMEKNVLCLYNLNACVKGSARYCVMGPSVKGDPWDISYTRQKKRVDPNTAVMKLKLYTVVSNTPPGSDMLPIDASNAYSFMDNCILTWTGNTWSCYALPDKYLIVSRNGRLTYCDGKIDLKIPEKRIYDVCKNICARVLPDLVNAGSIAYLNRIHNKQHLNYIPQIKMRRTISPVVIKTLPRSDSLPIDYQTVERILLAKRVAWKNCSYYSFDNHPIFFTWVAYNDESIATLGQLWWIPMKRKFINTKDNQNNVTNVKKYLKINYIDLRLIRRIGNDYIYDQNCRDIRINFSTAKPEKYSKYKKITIDIK